MKACLAWKGDYRLTSEERMNLELWPAFVTNWTSPGVIFLGVGGIAALFKADLHFPRQLRTLGIGLLLVALGFSGGLALSEVGLGQIWKQSLAMLGFGVLLPLWLWPIFRYVARLDVATSGVGAVQFASGNVAVFAATAAYLKLNHEFADDLSSGFLLLIPFAAMITIGTLNGYMAQRPSRVAWWSPIAISTAAAARSGQFILLGVASLSGYFAARTGAETLCVQIAPLVPLLGTLLMLDLGLEMGRQWRKFKGLDWVLAAITVVGPVVNAGGALYLARRAHLGAGMGTLLAMVAACGAISLAPMALRRVFPGSRAGVIGTIEAGIALPLNLVIGLPVYWQLAHRYL